MPVLFGGHLFEHPGRFRIAVMQPMRIPPVDPPVVFFGRDCQGEDLLFGEVLELSPVRRAGDHEARLSKEAITCTAHAKQPRYNPVSDMAMHLDHLSLSSPNLYYGAHRLRLESTLSFYDGGHLLNGDVANRIFPLGDNTYLEIAGIVNAESVANPTNRPWWYESVRTLGECFAGLCFRVDTREELEAIAKTKNYTIAQAAKRLCAARFRSAEPAADVAQGPAELVLVRRLPDASERSAAGDVAEHHPA